MKQVAGLSFIKSAAACGTGLFYLLRKESRLKSLKNYLVSQLEVLSPFPARKDSIVTLGHPDQKNLLIKRRIFYGTKTAQL